MSLLLQDVRYAVRGLWRTPGVTIIAALTLALGIGANAAVFGVVKRLLLSGPEQVREPERVRRVFMTAQPPVGEPVTSGNFGYVTYGLLRESRTLSGVAAYSVNPAATSGPIFGPAESARRLDAMYATHDLFPLLGTTAQVGRFFSAAEDDPVSPQAVVVLSDGFWRSDFGADPSVIGTTIRLSDEPFTVVGVAPAGFTGPQLGRVDVWTPMSWRSRTIVTDWPTSWNAQWLQVVARLREGVPPEQAGDEATALIRAGYTGTREEMRVATHSLRPLLSNDRGAEPGELAVARWLTGVGLLVLTIACANIANLLLARALKRRQEIGVRVALGAGRARVARMLVVEGLVLAGAAGALSLPVAAAIGRLMRDVLLPNVAWTSPTVDGTVLAISAGAALIVGIVVGVVPAWWAGRAGLSSTIGSGVRDGGGRTANLRDALTVAQAALSTVLLIGAGLFTACLVRVGNLDLGMEPDRVFVASVVWSTLPANMPFDARTAETTRREAVLAGARDILGRSDGVERASVTVGLPFVNAYSVNVRVDDLDSLPSTGTGAPQVAAVDEGFFATMGMALVRGRLFTVDEGAGTEPVAIVNETMARTVWPGGDPLGRCVYSGSEPAPCSRVVGVVADVRRSSLVEDPRMLYYIPWGQQKNFGGTNLLVRPTGSVPGTIATLNRVIRDLDPTVLYVGGQLLERRLDSQTRPWKLGAAVFGLLAALAGTVAAVGLYSVMSYLVAQRTHEIGVRLSLGATSSSVTRLILRRGLALAAVGVAIGGAAALALGRYLAPLLFQTSPRDPYSFVGAAGVMFIAALLASLIPALRARRINPLEALRV